MSVTEGKVWGETRPLLKTPAIEIHKIKVNKGGYCSKHVHQSKINAFYILEGILKISRWKNYVHEVSKIVRPGYDTSPMVDVTILLENDICVVPPGEAHMFMGVVDTTALEIYWTELDHNDIVRDTIGGCDEDLPDLFQNELKKVQTVFN